MTNWDIIFRILASLGGGGSIILFILGLWEKRKIAQYQNNLDILKSTTLRYSDKQFEFYNNLWLSLYELKVSGDELWQNANSMTLEKFSKQLKKTKMEVEKASLFIEDAHYEELVETLSHFSKYEVGKQILINYRRSQDNNDHLAEEMIRCNHEEKCRYESLIQSVKIDLKRQLKGI